MASLLHNTVLKYSRYELGMNLSCVAFLVLASFSVEYVHSNCLWVTCLMLHAILSQQALQILACTCIHLSAIEQ